MTSQVERAKEIAHRAHAGQFDKAGLPYIEHVSRVAASVSDDPDAETVAWLHDVIKNTKGYETEISNSFENHILVALGRVTRWPWMKSASELKAYYARIKANPLALKVKLADIADNSDEERLNRLDEKIASRLRKKYAKALKELS